MIAKAGRFTLMTTVALVASTQACDCDVEPIVAVEDTDAGVPEDILVPEDPPLDAGPAPEPPADAGTEEPPPPPPPPPPDDPPPADDCDVSSDKIYVIDRDTSDLHLFDPATNGLSRVGNFACAGAATPDSMAVSRGGKAYVRYDDALYEVDLSQATLPCVNTGYRNGSFGSFGMGYATDSATTWQDQLYIANTSEVAALDTDTWQRTRVTTLSSDATELTGNSAGQLWALALKIERGQSTLKRIDQHTGQVASSVGLSQLPDIFAIDTFALAAWGGNLYAFIALNGGTGNSEVWRITQTGQMTRVVNNLGINVVGAGVSTCAPGE